MTENLNHSYLNQSGLERYTEKLKDYLKDNYVSKEDEIVANDLTEFNSIEKEYTFVSKIANDGEEFRDNSAEITKIKGNTLIYNQLLKHINRKDEKNGLVFEQDGYGRVSVKGTATVDTAVDVGQAQLKTGHVYAFYGIDSETSSFIPDTMRWGDQDQGNDTGNGSISAISYPNENRHCVLYVKAGVKLDYYFYPKVTDLTQMFGVGNEPTTMEEFYNIAELIHISSDYNPGQFINGNYNGIKSISPESTKENPIESFYDLKTNDLFVGGMKSIPGTDIRDEIDFQTETAYDRVDVKDLKDLDIAVADDGYLIAYGVDMKSENYISDIYNVVADQSEGSIHLDENKNLIIVDTNLTDLNTLVEGGIPDNEIWYTTPTHEKINWKDVDWSTNRPTNTVLKDHIYSRGFGRLIFEQPVTRLELAYTMTGIGIGFYHTAVEKVILPKTIESIESHVFDGCTNLIFIDLPDSLVEMGGQVFQNCSSLTYIDLPSLSNIKTDTFKDCTNLTFIDLPDSFSVIGSSAFQNCIRLVGIDLPDSLFRIMNSAFQGCRELTNITIPESVEEIYGMAFSNCPKLRDVYCKSTVPPTIINGLTIFDEDVNIWVPYESVELYKEAWPEHASQILPGFNIPNDTIFYRSNDGLMIDLLETVEGKVNGQIKTVSVFNVPIISHTYEDGLGTIKLDGDVTRIGDSEHPIIDGGSYVQFGFMKNPSITDIVLPDSVTVFNQLCFQNCEKLTNVIINNRDSYCGFGMDAFGSCYSLTNLYFKLEPGIECDFGYGVFAGTALPYFISPNDNMLFPSFGGSGNTGVFDHSKLRYVDLKGSQLGDDVFKNCDLLERVKWDNSTITTIPYKCFANCNKLKYIDLSGVQEIKNEAFGDCDSLENINLSPDVVLGKDAFLNCTSLKRVIYNFDPSHYPDKSFDYTTCPIYVKSDYAFSLDYLRHNKNAPIYVPYYLLGSFENYQGGRNSGYDIRPWDPNSTFLNDLISPEGSVQYEKKEVEVKDTSLVTEFPFVKTYPGGFESLVPMEGKSSTPIVMSMIYNYRAKSRLDKISKFIAAPISPKMVDHILSECLSTSYNGSGPGWNGLFGDFED